MSTRVNLFQTVPSLMQTLRTSGEASKASSLDMTIKLLVDIRASQLNHCAFCLDMHVKQAKVNGERELRIYHLSIWRESPLFTAKEKAALAFCEALTHLDEHGITDELYGEVREHFSEVELSELAFSITVINSWNRLMVLSKALPGALDKTYGLDRAGLE